MANPKFRLADSFGRQVGDRHATFSAALAARTEGTRIEQIDLSCRWHPAICSVRIANVGQSFATVGQLVIGREIVGETRVLGFGFDSAVRRATLELAAKLGVEVAP